MYQNFKLFLFKITEYKLKKIKIKIQLNIKLIIN